MVGVSRGTGGIGSNGAAAPLLIMTLTIMAIGIYIPFSPLAHVFGLRPVPVAYFGWLAAILLGYAFLTHTIKTWFIRKYGFA